MRRVMPADRRAVFAEFADAGQLAQWWGPKGFTIPSIDFEPRPGATYRIQMQPPEGDSFFLTGTFTDVEPESRLAFTFLWEPADPEDVETLAELVFEDRGATTDVSFRLGQFKTMSRLELHRAGWTETFDKLEQ